MQYVRNQEGMAPEVVTMDDIRARFPNVSFPAELPSRIAEAYGLEPLTVEPLPGLKPDEERITGRELTQLPDGSWVQRYIVEPIPDAEREQIAEAAADRAVDGDTAVFAQAMVDLVLQLDNLNRQGASQPSKQNVLQSLRNRVAFYEKRRRGINDKRG